MKRRPLIVAVGSGLLCVLCVLAYAASIQAQVDKARNEAVTRYGGEQVDVVVAKDDILPGETVSASNAEVRAWVVDFLPEGAIASTDQAWGRQTTSYVAKGEVLVSKRFEGDAAAIDVPEGLVALSVPAEEVRAVGGAVKAGSRVDVFAVGSKASKIGDDVLVLATSGGDDGGSRGSVDWLTLALEPEKVQEYVAASESTSLHFALPASGGSSEASVDALGGSSVGAEDEGEGTGGER